MCCERKRTVALPGTHRRTMTVRQALSQIRLSPATLYNWKCATGIRARRSSYLWKENSMSIRFDKWITRMARVAEGRAIRDTRLIIPFDSRQASHYTSMMLRTIAAAEVKAPASLGPRCGASASADVLASDTEDGSGGDAGGGGGSSGDEDGDSDGDSDGPRRKPARRFKPSRLSATRHRSPAPRPSTSPLDRPHAQAFLAFTLVIAMVLGTALVFGLNGQPALAERTLGVFDSLATVAAALLLPK